MSFRIGIAVSGPEGLDSSVDERFGRAPYFIVVEGDQVVEQIPNQAADDAHGAGTGAARIMTERKVSAVIAGRFGPKAESALNALGVEVWSAAPGIPARDAVTKLGRGELTRVRLKVYE